MIMRTKFKQRILKLAKFLRKLPRKHFNIEVVTNLGCQYNRYGKETFVSAKDYQTIGKTLKPMNCGAAACAIGWCPSVFPHIVCLKDKIGLIDKKTGTNGWTRMIDYFGLSEGQSDYLFHDYAYRVGHAGKDSVAGRLEKFVAENGKVPPDYQY